MLKLHDLTVNSVCKILVKRKKKLNINNYKYTHLQRITRAKGKKRSLIKPKRSMIKSFKRAADCRGR